MAACATPGTGCPFCMTDAASPTTNTPGASTTFRNGSTIARPARSVLVPSIFGTGDAATPAVHSTVALGILIPPATTPCSSTVSTLTPVMTFTPSFSRRLATIRDTDSAKVGRTRLPASSRIMVLFDGSMRRKLRRGRREFHATGTCADQHERHLSRAFVLFLGHYGQFERAQDLGSDRLGVGETLES